MKWKLFFLNDRILASRRVLYPDVGAGMQNTSQIMLFWRHVGMQEGTAYLLSVYSLCKRVCSNMGPHGANTAITLLTSWYGMVWNDMVWHTGVGGATNWPASRASSLRRRLLRTTAGMKLFYILMFDYFTAIKFSLKTLLLLCVCVFVSHRANRTVVRAQACAHAPLREEGNDIIGQ